MFALTLALAFLIGCIVGLLGGGGAVLTLPMLVYSMHIPVKPAIASSLCMVAITSTVALIPYAIQGRIQWVLGLVFAAFGAIGAVLGGIVAKYVPPLILLIFFAALMLIMAIRMIRNIPIHTTEKSNAMSWPRALPFGLITGFFSGLVGAGGGFIVVPILIFFMNLSMQQATATALLIIGIQSSAGFMSHLTHTQIPIKEIAPIVLVSICGSLFGSQCNAYIKPNILRKAFGWLLLFVALFMIWKQISATLQ